MQGFTDRKLEIVKTASLLFNKLGYKNVTMRVLAEEMGIKAASLYNHIASKQEILSTVIISMAEQFTDSMASVMDNDLTPVEKIKSIIIHHIEITLNDPHGTASLQNDWMYLEGDNMVHFKRMRKQYENNFKLIIENGIEVGAIKNVNSETMLFSILTTLRSLYIWFPRQEQMDKEKLKVDMIRVLLDGIRT